LRRSPSRTTLSSWAVVEVVPMGATLSGPDTSPGAPGEVRLEAASFEAAGTGAELVPLAVVLSVPLGFVGAAR
jgi:predicted nucleotidyltransferase